MQMNLKQIEEISRNITDISIAALVKEMGNRGKVVDGDVEAKLKRSFYEIVRQGLNEAYGKEVILPKAPHWIISVGTPTNFTCLRCGETFRPALPVSAMALVGMISSFGEMHQNCQEIQPTA